MSEKIITGLSNHHVHVSEEVKDILFGKGYELHVKRKLKQLGQYACEETVNVYIGKNKISNVRLIGPTRKYTQVELLESDFVNCNLPIIYSDSGNLENTIPFKLEGPCGIYESKNGAFVAHNHIHFSGEDLKRFNLNKGDMVSVKTKDGTIIKNVRVKSDETCVLEFHMNKDEGILKNINTFDEVEIC